MRFLFVIDPLERLKKETDTSIALMRESLMRGHEVWHCNTVFWQEKILARAWEADKDMRTAQESVVPVSDFDAVLMRLEPPYDLHYHYITLLLDLADTLVLNRPQALRDANEKLAALLFPALIPATLVSRDADSVVAFVKKHGKAVLKPIHLFGGQGVTLVEAADEPDDRLQPKVEHYTKDGFCIAQEFLPGVYKGDKRVMMLDGKLLGAIRRVPQEGEFRANMVIGGKAEHIELDDDLRIVGEVGPWLRESGIFLAGLDIIDGKLIEINVTCPTGIVPIANFTGRNVAGEIVTALEQKVLMRT